MRWKEFVRDYFSFTRKDRIAIVVIAILLVLVIIQPYLAAQFDAKEQPLTDTAWITAANRLATQTEQAQPDNSEYNNPQGAHFVEKTPGLLFPFDPNTLDEAGWLRLGVPERTVKTILRYRQSGGRFKKPEDLQKVYGLRPTDFQRLLPYVRVAAITRDTLHRLDYAAQPRPVTPKPPFARIDINTADTSAFIALPGIGSKLAARIVLFREKLGGFYRVEQIGETFGLADSVFQKIRPWLQMENISLRKININSATPEELKAHPYIRYTIANAIVAYRLQHGPFQSKEDLLNIMVITNEILEKLSPYLE